MPIPILSVDPSTKNKLASVSPSILKSTAAPASLKIADPLTSKAAPGASVPIPKLPDVSKAPTVAEFVLKPNLLFVVVPIDPDDASLINFDAILLVASVRTIPPVEELR